MIEMSDDQSLEDNNRFHNLGNTSGRQISTKFKPEVEKTKRSLNTLHGSQIEEARLKCTKNYFYRCLLTLDIGLSLFEAVILGFGSNGIYEEIQLFVLITASVVFALMTLMTAAYFQPKAGKPQSFFYKLRRVCDAEVFLELLMFGLGWGFFYYNKAISAFRILRVFHLLWILEVMAPDIPDDYVASDNWFSVTKSSQLTLAYLERLYAEFATEDSRGGLVVLCTVFYTTYLFSVVFYLDKVSLPESFPDYLCDTHGHCFYTILKLGLFDGNGFDFMRGMLLKKNYGYALILFFYMIAVGIVFLNGLIGIFGHAFIKDEVEKAIIEDNFRDDNSDVIDDNDDHEEKGEETFRTHADLARLLSGLWDDLSNVNMAINGLHGNMNRLQADVRILQQRTRQQDKEKKAKKNRSEA